MSEDAPQREYSLGELFNGVRGIVRTGAAWRMRAHDLLPWSAGYQQGQRWRKAGGVAASIEELRAVVRGAQGRKLAPLAVMGDSRTLQVSPASRHRAGYEGAKCKRGSKVPIAVDTFGPRLRCVTAAKEQARAQGEGVVEQVQAGTGEKVEIAFGDQAYTGAQAAEQREIKLEVKLPEAKKGFVLGPQWWVVERSFAWAARLRRLAHD